MVNTMYRFLAAIILVFTLPMVSLSAQETVEPIDYDAWNMVAERAEASIESALASNRAFESLRSEIVVWRERFLRGQDTNAARIDTLRSQIEALGPPPADGEVEEAEIADRRRELGAQLSEALAPVTKAVEAFSRADGLAREIDGLIRERQTDALLRLGPSPLNPVNWPAAVAEFTGSLRAIQAESREAWSVGTKIEVIRDELPRIILYLLIAAVLLFRGRSILDRTSVAVLQRFSGSGRQFADFVLSLGGVVVPVAGLYLLIAALEFTGLLGLRGSLVAGYVPYIGVCTFGAHWLSRRLFPRNPEHDAPFHLLPEQAMVIRRWTTFLGFLVGATSLLNALAGYDAYSPETTAILFFPLAVLAGLALLRLGRVMIVSGRRENPDAEQIYRSRWLGFAGRLVVVFGVVGMVLTAVGYLNAGLYMLLPTAFTLGLLGLLLLLNEVLRDVYALVAGIELDDARAALIPTLLSFVLVVCSLPVFALIWGARTASLTELWAKFREGITLGETRISPEIFLTFVLVFVALYIATRIIQGALRINVLPKTQIDPGGQTAIVSGVGYIGIFLAALIAITAAGINLSSLAIVAGALSVGIGFGLQNIVQNFVSGIILLIERPVAEGDWIQVGGHMGTVKKISVRSTLIETFDRTDVIVPNGDFIAGAVMNWTRTDSIGRIKVPVGVAYGTDTRRVSDILKAIAEEHPLVTVNPEPAVDFLGFGADSLDFQIRAVLRDVNYSMTVKTEMNHCIAERFAEEGIEIPFAQRDIWLRNPEALANAPDGKKSLASSERDLPKRIKDREIDPELGDGGNGDT